MTYSELEKLLFSIADEKFACFSKSLSNSDYISIGVKNPVLRQIIKEHKNDSDLKTEDFILGKYLEIDFIYFGLSLSRLPSSKEQLDFLLRNAKNAKSWAITDCLSSFMRSVKFEDYEKFFIKSYKTNDTYLGRMGYVLGLKQYKDERIVNIVPLIQLNEEYIVMMAEAWLLSVIALKQEGRVYTFLQNCPDLTLKRKTISKINDSFRFSEETKNKFKLLR